MKISWNVVWSVVVAIYIARLLDILIFSVSALMLYVLGVGTP